MIISIKVKSNLDNKTVLQMFMVNTYSKSTITITYQPPQALFQAFNVDLERRFTS